MQEDPITLILGDCAEKLKEIPSESVDLVVTSPPYDNLREYKGYSFDFEKIATELSRVIKQGGVIVWVVGDATVEGSETGTSFRQALYFKDALGLNIHDTMIYLKDQLAFPDSARYYNAFEYMFVLSKGKPSTFNPIKDRINKSEGRKVHGPERRKDGGLREQKACAGNICERCGVRWNYWLIYNQNRGLETQHPATFPLSLASDHIYSWSKEGDTVLDPFMGSGTTGAASIELGRKFIGIEIAPDYYEIAKLRIASPNAIKTRWNTSSQFEYDPAFD